MSKIQQLEEFIQNVQPDIKRYEEFDTGNSTHTINIIIHKSQNRNMLASINIDGQDIQKDQVVADGQYFPDENDDKYQDAHFNVVLLPEYIPGLICIDDFPTDYRLQKYIFQNNLFGAVNPITLKLNKFYIAQQIWQYDFTSWDNEEFTDEEAKMANFLLDHWLGSHWDSSTAENKYNQEYNPALKELVEGSFGFFYDFSEHYIDIYMKQNWNTNVQVEPNESIGNPPEEEYLSSGCNIQNPHLRFDEQIDGYTVIIKSYKIGNIPEAWIKTSMNDQPLGN